MYTTDELNDKLLSELKNITEELEIKGASKLSKQDLIYKILDEQAISKPKKRSDKSKESDKSEKKPSKRNEKPSRITSDKRGSKRNIPTDNRGV